MLQRAAAALRSAHRRCGAVACAPSGMPTPPAASTWAFWGARSASSSTPSPTSPPPPPTARASAPEWRRGGRKFTAGNSGRPLIKDRAPFPGADRRDGKAKLVVLLDAEAIPADAYARGGRIEAALSPLGTVCLRRYFCYQRTAPWAAMEPTAGFEMFRVDTFVPVHIQIAADATHVLENRALNLASGVVFVVAEAEAAAYGEWLERFSHNYGVPAYVVDATGAVRYAVHPPRPQRGAHQS